VTPSDWNRTGQIWAGRHDGAVPFLVICSFRAYVGQTVYHDVVWLDAGTRGRQVELTISSQMWENQPNLKRLA